MMVIFKLPSVNYTALDLCTLHQTNARARSRQANTVYIGTAIFFYRIREILQNLPLIYTSAQSPGSHNNNVIKCFKKSVTGKKENAKI